MQVESTKNGTVLDIKVTGSINSNTYQDLDKEIAKNLGDATRVNLDFKDVDYVSSAGLRVILSLHKKLISQDGLHIYHTQDAVKEVFDITGFLDILNLED